MTRGGSTVRPEAVDAIQPVVLVGGRSRRFGRDKLAEPLLGRPLVHRPIDALREVFGPRVLLVGDCDPAIAALAEGAIPDTNPGAGPAGGIAAALDHGGVPIFVLAGDMPAVQPQDIRRIIAAAERDPRAAAFIACTDRPHPCFGLYRVACRSILRQRLERGEHRLLDALPARLLVQVPVTPGSAININSVDDLARLAPLAQPPPAGPADTHER